MRGRLIFRFLAELCRLDRSSAEGQDPDFKESMLRDSDDDGIGERVRREYPPILVPCQVDTKAFEELRMLASGNAPRSQIHLVFHFKDLERMALVDTASGDALIQPGDRLATIKDTDGAIVHRMRTGLYVTESRPIGFGLGMARPRRNLLLVTLEDRRQGARRFA